MKRRSLLALVSALVPAAGAVRAAGPIPSGRMTPQVEEIRRNWKALLAAGAEVAADPAPLTLSKEEWRKRLSPVVYSVLREEGTERSFSSALNDEKRRGVYVCAGCAWPLFTSEMKFDSGTGWPSYFTTIPGGFATSTDYKLLYPRIEYHCAKCGGHHGHVFDDGPMPTGQRWCNNGVALRFIAA